MKTMLLLKRHLGLQHVCSSKHGHISDDCMFPPCRTLEDAALVAAADCNAMDACITLPVHGVLHQVVVCRDDFGSQ